MDHNVVKFLTNFQYQKSEQACSTEDKVSLIQAAIKTHKSIDMVYLKANDDKSKRTIKPYRVEQMQYAGKPYLGVEGFCLKRQEDRVFRVDRILEIKITD